MSARTRNLLLGALSLAVIAVTFFVVLPKIANYRDVWDVVSDLDPIWLIAFGVGVVLNVVTFAPPWMITLPGLRFVQALLFTQASTAFTYIAPGGGIVGMAGSYGLLRTWGFGSSEVARAVAITGIWNQLSNLLLPVVAVTLLSIEGGQDALRTGLVRAVDEAKSENLMGDTTAGALTFAAERLPLGLLLSVLRGASSFLD